MSAEPASVSRNFLRRSGGDAGDPNVWMVQPVDAKLALKTGIVESILKADPSVNDSSDKNGSMNPGDTS